MIIIGTINCQSTNATYANPQPDFDQYNEVCKIVNEFHHPRLPQNALHIVAPSNANFYGGTKVSFTLDYKHSYYPWIDKSVIEALEDLMSQLPFENAVLYSEIREGMVIEWHSKEYMERCQLQGEPSKYPSIYRIGYGGDLDLLPTHLPREEGWII